MNTPKRSISPLRIPILLILAVLLGALLTACLAPQKDAEEEEPAEIGLGGTPPDFTLVDLEGNSFTLSEMAGVKPVVIDFWASWCPPCRLEFPLLNEFTQMHGDEVVVIGISSEDAESGQAVRDFVRSRDAVFRVFHDPSRQVIDAYKVLQIPTVMVIDESGKIVDIHVGYSADIVKELEDSLGLESVELEPAPTPEEEIPAQPEETPQPQGE